MASSPSASRHHHRLVPYFATDRRRFIVADSPATSNTPSTWRPRVELRACRLPSTPPPRIYPTLRTPISSPSSASARRPRRQQDRSCRYDEVRFAAIRDFLACRPLRSIDLRRAMRDRRRQHHALSPTPWYPDPRSSTVSRPSVVEDGCRASFRFPSMGQRPDRASAAARHAWRRASAGRRDAVARRQRPPVSPVSSPATASEVADAGDAVTLRSIASLLRAALLLPPPELSLTFRPARRSPHLDVRRGTPPRQPYCSRPSPHRVATVTIEARVDIESFKPLAASPRLNDSASATCRYRSDRLRPLRDNRTTGRSSSSTASPSHRRGRDDPLRPQARHQHPLPGARCEQDSPRAIGQSRASLVHRSSGGAI